MPLVPLVVAWLMGELAGTVGPGARPGLAGAALGAAVLCAMAVVAGWPQPRVRWAALLALAAWLGLARSMAALPPAVPPADALQVLNVPADAVRAARATPLTVRGRVVADPVPARNGKASQMRVSAEAVQTGDGWRRATGGLLVMGDPFPAAVAGDEVACTGVVQDPPPVSGFDYAAWLARQGVGSYMDHATVQVLAPAGPAPGSLLAAWRRDAGVRIAAELPEPAAGQLRAVLLGQKDAIGALKQDFVASGMSWVIVVSGVHLAVLMMMIWLPLERILPLRARLVVAGAFVLGYAVFVGWAVAVARAAVMAVLWLAGRALGRPVSTLNLLALAALLFTTLDPLIILDVGFQLSFAAVAGILLLAPPLSRRWRRLPILGEMLAVAVAVQLATWPIVAVQFGTFTPVAVPAGVAAGLLLEVILPLGAAQVLAGWLWAPLGQVVAWVCWLPLAGLAAVVHLAAQVQNLLLTYFALLWALLWYAGLVPPLPPHFDWLWAFLWYTLLAAVYLRTARRADRVTASGLPAL